MADDSQRIPDDAEEDIPPQTDPAVEEVDDPDAAHRRGMDRTKLTFATWLIAACVVIAVTLSLIQFYTQNTFRETAVLTSAIDLMKLLATSALGFVYGRSLDKRDG